jgi:hypothetical protein
MAYFNQVCLTSFMIAVGSHGDMQFKHRKDHLQMPTNIIADEEKVSARFVSKSGLL